MVRVAAKWFEGLGYRGSFTLRNEMRFTLRLFEDMEEAELWALTVLLRFRSVFEPSPPAPLPKGEGSHADEG